MKYFMMAFIFVGMLISNVALADVANDLIGLIGAARESVVTIYVLPSKDAAEAMIYEKTEFATVVKDGFSIGSGFFIDSDGHIVTNEHVVHDDRETKKGPLVYLVKLNDDIYAIGELIGSNEAADIAVLKIPAIPEIRPASLGDSSLVRVGDPVFAIGSPEGLVDTVTTGVVSNTARWLQSVNTSLIQTDASINSGNSGGPLFNYQGQIIGINEMIFSPGAQSGMAGSIGLGFSIPINYAMSIAHKLINNEPITYGSLGVGINDYYSVGTMDEYRPAGVLVNNLAANSPAVAAGFQIGDIIIKVNDISIKNKYDLISVVASLAKDTIVNVTVVRNGEEIVLTPTITNR